MRGMRVMDDTAQASQIRPWSHWDLLGAATRNRRFEQYAMWAIPLLFAWVFYRSQFKRKVYWQLERWDYEDKYWRDGYWIKEFPEGMKQVTYANGAVSIEPGMSSTDWKKSFGNWLFQVD